MSEILLKVHRDDPSIGGKISKSLKQAYNENPEYRKAVSDASKNNWKSLDYQEKVTGHGYHHGYYISRCGRIYFASSWELMFLTWCEDNEEIVEFGRCEDRVKYEKPGGGIAYYHPDFQIEWKSGRVDVIEIKGGIQKIEQVERKRRAAIEFYGKSKGYLILFKREIQNLGVFRGSKKVQEWIGELEELGKVVEHAKGKKDKKSSP